MKKNEQQPSVLKNSDGKKRYAVFRNTIVEIQITLYYIGRSNRFVTAKGIPILLLFGSNNKNVWF